MLMVRSGGDPPDDVAFWGAVKVEGVGRALSREQAEAIAARTSHQARFLFPHTDQTVRFGPTSGSAPTLAMLSGETIWHYGEPTKLDSLAVLQAVADGAESPAPDSVALPVADVLRVASSRFGEGDAHDVEAHFDALVLELDGRRADQPPCYLVPISRLLA